MEFFALIGLMFCVWIFAWLCFDFGRFCEKNKQDKITNSSLEK